MAPSSGLLAPMAMRIVRQVYRNTAAALRARLPFTSNPSATATLQPIPLRSVPRNHELYRLAFLRQSRGRWYTTHSRITATLRRHFSSGGYNTARSAYPTSATATLLSRRAPHIRTPFASQLRPNLTGGALPRSAGGYGTAGGSARRYFSHTPAAPAQVMRDVSVAVRGFWLSGQRARALGGESDRKSGAGQRYAAVSALQGGVEAKVGFERRKLGFETAPGSAVYFHLLPTITALSSFAGYASLAGEGVLGDLEGDLKRAEKDLAAMRTEIAALAALGDLPIVVSEGGSTVAVRFPGVDEETLERLCDDVIGGSGIRRGYVKEDDGFGEEIGEQMALLFPFAGSEQSSVANGEGKITTGSAKREAIEWQAMLDSPLLSTVSNTSHEFERVDDIGNSSDLDLVASPSGDSYESLGQSEGSVEMFFEPRMGYRAQGDAGNTATDPDVQRYEGFEGIYRFWEECDGALSRQ